VAQDLSTREWLLAKVKNVVKQVGALMNYWWNSTRFWPNRKIIRIWKLQRHSDVIIIGKRMGVECQLAHL
jgi:hypothetical protein